MHRYKRPEGSAKSSRASAQSGTGKGSQKNSGIGFDSRSFKGKSKVLHISFCLFKQRDTAGIRKTVY